MAYKVVEMPGFGGLNLRDEADRVGASGAIDLLNVDLDKRGAVRTRPGHETWAAPTGTESYGSPLGTYLRSGGHYNIIGGSDTNAYAYALDEAGALVVRSASFGGAGNVVDQAAIIGTPSSQRVYVGGRTSVASNLGLTVQRFNGSAWTAPGTLPAARCLGVQSADNRLVGACTGASAGPGGATSSSSHVWFSNAGDPETWGANDYVQLTPGDGQDITGVVSWRDQLFVFKNSKFFVFWGNSIDADGESVFNYRTVDAGVGANQAGCAVAARDGVYFLDRAGVYRTTGGPPEKVSERIDAWFQNKTSSFYTGAVNSASTIAGRIATANEKLLVTVQDASSYTSFVLDLPTGEWLRWSFPGAWASAGVIRIGDIKYLANGLGPVSRIKEGLTTDTGTAITARYRSGFYTIGNSVSQEVTIPETIIEGIGAPSFSLARDFGSVPTTAGGAKATVTLGTSPAYAQGRHSKAQSGRRFSYQIESTSGAWRVNSITHHAEDFRSPGLKTT